MAAKVQYVHEEFRNRVPPTIIAWVKCTKRACVKCVGLVGMLVDCSMTMSATAR